MDEFRKSDEFDNFETPVVYAEFVGETDTGKIWIEDANFTGGR